VAETSIIIRRWRLSINADQTENALTFDAVLREEHTSELTVTDSPLETGVVVSDHAYMLPRRYSMEGAFSNTPMYQEGTGGGFGVLVGGDGIKPAADNGIPRAANAWGVLTKLQELAVPFDVQSGLVLYKNMVITRLSTTQEETTVGALFFTAELREVLFATSQEATWAPRAPKRSQPKKKTVERKAEEPTTPQGGKLRKSLLLQGAQAVGIAQ
jgi:hypothetical protein